MVNEDFFVNALIQALGDNGQCPIPETETFYTRSKSLSLAERLGEGENSPFANVSRSGVRIAGATHAGKAIEDIKAFGLRRNGTGATGELFATVRNDSDFIVSTSTNSILAQNLPTSGAGEDITFTFPERVVLKDGDRIQVEFPNCVGCADSASSPNVFWFGTSTASPAGTERTFFSKTATDSGSYFETTVGFTQGLTMSFTTSPEIPAKQHGCAEVNSLLSAPNSILDFTIDGIPFIPPARLFLVNAILTDVTSDIDKTFRIDGHVFILPVKNVLVDAIIRYAQGASKLGSIPDLIIRVLRENGVLTGDQIVDEVVKITSDPAEGISFRGKTSRIKNWLNRLRLDGLIQEDGSDPDWFETNWSLV